MDFNAWLSDGEVINDTTRASASRKRNTNKPSTIVVERPDGTRLAAQTVLVEYDNAARTDSSAVASSGRRRCVVYGTLNHPTAPDLNIQVGDRFAVTGASSSAMWDVTDVIDVPGERQAVAERQT